MTSDQATGGGDIGRRDALPPDAVLNDYRLERVLGAGGFGIVYLARHEELARRVAIKEYLPAECAVREGLSVKAKGNEYRAAFEEGLTRFRDEARRLVELEDHPAIVSCRDFFRANGTAYLVMEYVEGQPLSDVLSAREAEGQPFDQVSMLNVIVPLLEGLLQAHAAGIIHRDIKPGNIMIRDQDGHPALIDFGAAKQGVAELTKSMAPFTEGYAALEQVGEGKLGPWTDIYAIGAVMWRMVAGGSPPWDPSTPVRVESRARAQLGGAEDPLLSARDLGRGRFSAGVLRVIDECLRLQESERIQNCGDLLRNLSAEATGSAKSGLVYAPANWRFGNSRVSRRLGLLVAALGALLLVGAMSLVLSTEESGQDRNAERKPLAESSASSAVFDEEIQDGPSSNEVALWPSSQDSIAEYNTAESPSKYTTAINADIRADIREDPSDDEVSIGSFSVLAQPSDSTVEFLDREGQYVPGMPLPSGRYRVQISAPGYQTSQVVFEHGSAPTVLPVRLDVKVIVENDPKPSYPDPAERNKHDANIQFIRGNEYYYGKDAPPDYAEALAWFLKAAEQGHAEAQMRLGDMYYEGEGVPSNVRKAAAWYRKAAGQGHSSAQYKLGRAYYYGAGVPEDNEEAARWYRKSGEQGHVDAQWSLALLYDGGLYVLEDNEEAAVWYRKAAEQGHRGAQGNLGKMYYIGEGVVQDRREAATWFRKAADQGDISAQFSLGLMYLHGEGVPQIHGQAAAWFRKAADQGNLAAQSNLGMMYANGKGVAKDAREAATWFRKAADQGDISAQFSLGLMYLHGEGVPQIHGQAAAWFRKAADQGNLAAQSNLGMMYANGKGVAKDAREAVAWYRKAANQGLATAQNNLGVMYYIGEGVPKDVGQAAEWYRKAAEQGAATAQVNLGLLYATGDGVPKDAQEAVSWYQKAAVQGDVKAQFNLGLMFANGRGVSRDYVRAYAWWNIASAQGHENAKKHRDRIRKKMPRKRIMAAQELSRELVPQ